MSSSHPGYVTWGVQPRRPGLGSAIKQKDLTKWGFALLIYASVITVPESLPFAKWRGEGQISHEIDSQPSASHVQIIFLHIEVFVSKLNCLPAGVCKGEAWFISVAGGLGSPHSGKVFPAMRKRGTCRLEIKMVAVDPNHIRDCPGEELHLSVCLSLKAPEDISIAKPLCIWVSDSCLHLFWMRPNPPRHISVCIPAVFFYLPRGSSFAVPWGHVSLGC